jgi:hypothetical protein
MNPPKFIFNVRPELLILSYYLILKHGLCSSFEIGGTPTVRAFSLIFDFQYSIFEIAKQFWRTGGDLNPRYGFTPYDSLANCWFKPLTHLSVISLAKPKAATGHNQNQGIETLISPAIFNTRTFPQREWSARSSAG